MSVKEASEFWDAHSLFEYEGTEEVDVEFHLSKKKYIGINYEIFRQLEETARRMNTTPEALLETWIFEKINST